MNELDDWSPHMYAEAKKMKSRILRTHVSSHVNLGTVVLVCFKLILLIRN